MSNVSNNKIFDIYEYLNVDKSESRKIIFDKIIKKLLELNKLLKSEQYRSKELVLKLQEHLINALTYFTCKEGKEKYDKLLESKIENDIKRNKEIILSDLIEEVYLQEKQHRIHIGFDYIKLLEILSFITDISYDYPRINKKVSNHDFALIFVRRAFSNAHLNDRKMVLEEDFISVVIKNEKLNEYYRNTLAIEMFNNWYPVLKK